MENGAENCTLQERIEAFYRQSGGPNNPDIQRILQHHLLYGKDHGVRGKQETIADAFKTVISEDKTNKTVYQLISKWMAKRDSPTRLSTVSAGSDDRLQQLEERIGQIEEMLNRIPKASQGIEPFAQPILFDFSESSTVSEEKAAYGQILSQLFHAETAILRVYGQFLAAAADWQMQVRYGFEIGTKSSHLGRMQELLQHLGGVLDPHPALQVVTSEIENSVMFAEKVVGVDFLLRGIVLPVIYQSFVKAAKEPLITQVAARIAEYEASVKPDLLLRMQTEASQLDQTGKDALLHGLDRWLPKLEEVITDYKDAAAVVGVDVSDIRAHIISLYLQHVSQVGLM